MKKVLSLAIAAALVAPAAAMADATLFGKAHFIVENVDTKASTTAQSGDVWGVDSIHSRIGVKGSEDLGDGLKALYHFEFRVMNDAGTGLGDRNQFVGLAGGFGTVLLGRHDTPLKMSQGKFDQFGDLPNGDITGVIPGEDRVDNVIAYVSPAMSGLTFVGALVSGELGDGGAATDSDALTGLADHISLAGLYSNGPIFASLAYNSYDLGTAAVGVEPSLLRGTFIWNAGMWQAGVMFSSLDLDIPGANDPDQIGVSGNVKVGSAGKVKAQYLMGDSARTSVSSLLGSSFSPNVSVANPVSSPENEVTQISVGYEHAMSKRTTLHAGYTVYEEDQTGREVDALFGGIIHNF
ncbi:MAG: porin [Candidatus Thiodiazotropha sp. (ex Monitilora ramsayi)]|nr:porin [Candidatus Thiodiazotropha sp. (ex Monitilora ramsayi)]